MAIRSVARSWATSAGCSPSTVNATVGVRSAIDGGPQTRTPEIDDSPSSNGPNTAISARPSASRPVVRRKRAAASMAAIASKLGVPVSHRRGPWSGAGRTLATGSSASRDGVAHRTPACGPYHL